MNILAIETATPACAVGIRTASGLEVSRIADDGRRHTEALTQAMSELLAEVGLQPRAIERVVVDRGPGLFTGLRVGIATAIAFAQALGCELVGVTSLEVLAHGAFAAGVRGTVICCVDGRRGELFTQEFTVGDDVMSVNDAHVAPANVVTASITNLGDSVTCTGDGVERYLDQFQALAHVVHFAQSVPPVHAALQVGATRACEASITPLYLRDADAVANFSTRQRPS